MAVLTDSERAEIAAQFHRDNSEAIGAITKPQLRAVVDALDDFLNTNASAINTSIPTPQRTILTTSQKARLFGLVVRKRYL